MDHPRVRCIGVNLRGACAMSMHASDERVSSARGA
jgi:hypothetical protein